MPLPNDDEERLVTFESDGLPCVMIRHDVWCGYVGVGQDHPWFGLPYNALVKPTPDMIKNRHPNDYGPVDLLSHVLSGKDPTEEIQISMALRVHGGVTWTDDHVPNNKPDGYWYFGFDCGHAGDYSPLIANGLREAANFMSPEMIEKYRKLISKGVWRDRQYVVSECQFLAAQLVKVKERFA
jgi:hypothetical protein